LFVVAAALFVLPSWLLWLAWHRAIANEKAIAGWRQYLGDAALAAAGCATVLELIFFSSWFYNGGSPHGLMPAVGIWKIAGPIAFYALIASLILSVLGKGKWRWLMPIWAAAFLFAAYATFMLDLD